MTDTNAPETNPDTPKEPVSLEGLQPAAPAQDASAAPAEEPYRGQEFIKLVNLWMEGKGTPSKAASEPILQDIRDQVANVQAARKQLDNTNQASQQLQGQLIQLQGQIDALSRTIYRIENG